MTKIPGSAHDTTVKSTVLDAQAHLCLLASNALHVVKDKDYCPIEIIKGQTDKGQFQYLTKLMGPQEGTYLYATQFHSLR